MTPEILEDITTASFYLVDNATGQKEPWDVSRERLATTNHSTHNGLAFTVKRTMDGNELMATCLISPLHGIIQGDLIGHVNFFMEEEATFANGTSAYNTMNEVISINSQGLPSIYGIVDMVYNAISKNESWVLDCQDVTRAEYEHLNVADIAINDIIIDSILLSSEEDRQDSLLNGSDDGVVN